MFENLFNRSQSVTLDSFLDSTDSPTWEYLATLRLKASQLHQATRAQIMDNPGDVALLTDSETMIIYFDESGFTG